MSPLLLALLLATAAPGDGSAPPAPEHKGFDVSACAMQETLAAATCCGSVALVGFGVATLGISPVFANVPLPIGVCGIAMGAAGMGSAAWLACSAPFEATAPSRSRSERDDDDDDGGDDEPSSPLVVMAF